MDAITTHEHITIDPAIASGRPHISGRRISVRNIVIWHEQMGYSVDEIATEYGLTLAEIYAALAYYYDNKAVVDAEIRQSDVFVDTLRAKTPSLLARKLNERPG